MDELLNLISQILKISKENLDLDIHLEIIKLTNNIIALFENIKSEKEVSK